jgi:hypothetical protein
LPALAVLTIELLARSNRSKTLDVSTKSIGNSTKPIGNSTKPISNSAEPFGPRLAALNFLTPAILLIVAALYVSGHDGRLKSSQKDSAEYYLQVRPNADSGLYYYRRRYYSSEFYSAGKAKMVEKDQLSDLLVNGHDDFLVIYAEDLDQLSPALRAHFQPVRNFGEFVMLREI